MLPLDGVSKVISGFRRATADTSHLTSVDVSFNIKIDDKQPLPKPPEDKPNTDASTNEIHAHRHEGTDYPDTRDVSEALTMDGDKPNSSDYNRYDKECVPILPCSYGDRRFPAAALSHQRIECIVWRHNCIEAGMGSTMQMFSLTAEGKLIGASQVSSTSSETLHISNANDFASRGSRSLSVVMRTDDQWTLLDLLPKFDPPRSDTAATITENYDLRKIFDGSIVQARPIDVVTLIDNHDTQSGQALESTVPAQFMPLTTPSEFEKAVANAEAAFPEWRVASLLSHQQVMFKLQALICEHMDDIANTIVLKQGKTFVDAKGDILCGLQVVEVACGITCTLMEEHIEVSKDMDTYTRRESLGVTAAIAPNEYTASQQRLDEFGQSNDFNSSNYELGRTQVYYISSSFEVRPNGTQPAQVTANTNAGLTSATLSSATRCPDSNDMMEHSNIPFPITLIEKLIKWQSIHDNNLPISKDHNEVAQLSKLMFHFKEKSDLANEASIHAWVEQAFVGGGSIVKFINVLLQRTQEARKARAEMEEEHCITTMDMAAVVLPPELCRTILQVFTTKHSLQLHSSAIGFITLTLTQHGLLDQPLEWEEAIDVLAQGIVDGQLDVDPHSSRVVTCGGNQNVDTEPSDVVMATALEKVYSRLVVADSAAHMTQGALTSTFSANDVPWQGAISVKEEAAFQVHKANHSDLCIVIFSDLSTIIISTEAASYADIWKDALDDISYSSEGSPQLNDHQIHVAVRGLAPET
ncbi:uncharacterized protein UHOD_12290 [Ustilago sp. UG-2017b]|nr:uncharacterized protein UHOD_12290 [Ustilago sp. UG-2017b]